MKRLIAAILAAVLLAGQPTGAQQPGEQSKLAVFNFQMRTDSPDWRWLEKFLSDQLTTDLATSRTLTVVARDEIQLLSSQMNWVPEMAQDAGPMGQISGRLTITYLVSGVYSINGEQIEIIGQIVEIKTRKELFRKVVSGRPADVLDLQKKLSGELLGWFVKKPPAEVQAALPIWTKVLPAAKALYGGMDLYDHGRYAAAWLKFRAASHADPDYMEAIYWVGKMYYFMNRYEHARMALERFVYMSGGHPRIGDAIKEYLDTYEQLDAPPEVLLELYEDFRDRWPQASIHDPYFPSYWNHEGSCKRWLDQRTGRVLQAVGRYEEAARFAAPAYAMRTIGSGICVQNVVAASSLAGKTVPDEVLIGQNPSDYDRGFPVRFDKGQSERRLTMLPVRSTNVLAIAPEGQVFKKMRFYVDAAVNGADMVAVIHSADSPSVAAVPPVIIPMTHAATDGVTIDALPLGGMFIVQFSFQPHHDTPGQPGATVPPVSVRMTAECELVPGAGAVAVTCLTAPDFKVSVDGRPGRALDGLIGPLSAGRHVVRFEPFCPDSCYAPWETTVEVERGKVTAVQGQLTWNRATPLAGWKASRIATTYPGPELCLSESYANRPCLLAEPDRLRMLWVYRRDIWSASSTDGVTFSPAKKLELPISSAWSEDGLRCIRDEAGRYMLLFKSDRDAQHRDLCYVTWSRDFEHWSSPTMVDTKTSGVNKCYDLIQDRSGRFLLLSGYTIVKMVDGRTRATDLRLNLLISMDGVRWEDRGQILTIKDPLWTVQGLRLEQLDEGSYRILGLTCRCKSNDPSSEPFREAVQIIQARSNDLARWEVESMIMDCPGGVADMGVVRQGDYTQIMLFMMPTTSAMTSAGVRVLWRDGAGPWMMSPPCPDVAQAAGCLAVHPKWGCFIAAMSRPAREWSIRPVCGPYVLSGPSLEPLLAGSQPVKPIRPEELEPKVVVVIPAELRIPLSQPDFGLPSGSPTPKACVQAVHDLFVNPNGPVLLLPHFDPRFRNEHAKELGVIYPIQTRMQHIVALAKANLKRPSAEQEIRFLALRNGVLFDPLAAATLPDESVVWPGVTITEQKDAAVVATERSSADLVKVEGKWYLKSPYSNPAGRKERQLQVRRWAVLLNALEVLEQHLLDGKVARDSFSVVEIDRIDRRLDKEVPIK